MQKKLCLGCAQAMQKRADIRYTGKRTQMGICDGCHGRVLVTEYIVPDETPKPTPKSLPEAKPEQPKASGSSGEKWTISLTVDSRTAAAIVHYADRWQVTNGEVVDSLTCFLQTRNEKEV